MQIMTKNVAKLRISLKGEREARKLAAEYTKKAHEILKSVGGNSLILQELMNYMLNRNY